MGMKKKQRKPVTKSGARSAARALPDLSTSGADPVWHGSSAIEMQVGSPEIVIGDDGFTTTTLIFAGLATALESERPARGATIGDYAGTVRSSRLQPGRGLRGTLTVTLKNHATSPPEPPEVEPEPLYITWEIDWRSTEKPLTSNPKLVTQGSGTTQVTIDEVETWRNSPQQRKRNYQIPLNTLTREPDANNDADWEDLAGQSLSVARKIAAGVEAWLEFTPVVIKISIFEAPVATAACGKIGNPTYFVAGYVYLKTGDTLTQQANKEWRRTETWQGSASWDTDLYENA